MNDLISRQAAIEAIRNIKAIKGTSDDKILLIDKAEAQTELMMLPSAQPKERTEERAETHACDLIDRQAAIDAVNNLIYPSSLVDVKRILVDLPSAQPEIIRCKDCKFYSPMNRETKTGICNLIMHQNFGDNWFCAGAERRPDESDRKRRCPMADGT